MRFWNKFTSWSQAEKAWDEGATLSQKQSPIKKLNVLPNMPGMTEETAKHLKWTAFKWMVRKDEHWNLLKKFLRHPFRYSYRLVSSLIKNRSYTRDGDFFFYGLKDEAHFLQLLENTNALLVIGFSYCHKPFECPSGRFTDKCIADSENSVCRQCFIGKCVNALPERRTVPLFIPTIHYIGGKILDLIRDNPGKEVVFLITACEMTLEMFGDLGHMAGIKGIGVRLDGRICNTLKAFELSEIGIKPGLTVVRDETKERMLSILKQWSQQAGFFSIPS